MKSIIYLVVDRRKDAALPDDTRLIKGSSRAAIERYLAAERWLVSPATPLEVAHAMNNGARLESASEDDDVML